MNAAVTLTPEESRRLIARAIAGMDVIRKAMKVGTIGLAMCSSAGYVAEELLGQKMDLSAYACGFIHADGWCYVAPERRGPGKGQLIIRRGIATWLDFPRESLADLIADMGPGDVIIKSGNVLDTEGRVGILVGDADGGEAGRYLSHIQARGITSVVPMTIAKALPVSLDNVTRRLGSKAKSIDKRRAYGVACGMLPWPGTVVTELEAFQWLSGAEALPIAAGGYGSGAGCVSFYLEGPGDAVDKAWKLVHGIKGEPPLKELFGVCKTCEIYKEEACSARRVARRRTATEEG